MDGLDVRDTRWASRVAGLVIPVVLTSVAFAILSGSGLIGNLPLWILVSLLVLAMLVGELLSGGYREDASLLALHGAIVANVLAVTAIIYAIGWGPTLMIGYVFVLARALDAGGSRVWRPMLLWSAIGVFFGQLAIVLNIVPTYVDAPYVHGLAVLGILGTAFIMQQLGSKTEQNECSDREVRTNVSLLSATLDSTADGVLVVDNAGAITHHNTRFAQMWRIPQELLTGRETTDAIALVLDQLERPESFLATIDDLRVQPDGISDDTLDFKDGRVFERHSRPQRVDGVIVGRVWSFRDVTDRNQLVDQLAYQAFHDDLTGLANRGLLRDRLEHALARSRRSAVTVAVLFCDLDGFKMINDTLGHDAGDLLLVDVAARFQVHVREGDTVARLGGDEFAIVLDETTPEDAARLAQRFLDALRDPFTINGREIFVRASIGIAHNLDDALDADELLCRADIAMYAAKARGRDRCEAFESEMQMELTAYHELHGDLRHALQRGELAVYYQPLFDLETQRVESFEALLRWHHPRRGLVGPDEFIPIAEESGLIIDIGRYVLEEACRQAVEWRDLPGAENLRIGVNVSSHQIYDDAFLEHVTTALNASGLPPTSLILELTETTLLSDTTHIHDRLAGLKDLGVKIAIDDFGTGYSSLAYLHTFPVDILKIDRSFVSELTEEDQGRVMVRSIISIGQNLKLGVVAEGIERATQLEELRDAGCDTGQGYLFARPEPAERIPELLALHMQAIQVNATEPI
jgi:diguanylate cyclase (GGDEF)-like protein/PAS domain S-box-containing protein